MARTGRVASAPDVARRAGGIERDDRWRVGKPQGRFGGGLQRLGADALQHGVHAQARGRDVDHGQVGVDARDHAGAGKRVAALAQDLGMLGAAFSEEHGGLGGGHLENALIMEEMGKVTSGQLAIRNHYCISRKKLLENLENKENG